MSDANPHSDDEYQIQRRPDVYSNWTKSFQLIWNRIERLAKGKKRPLLTINVSQWAKDLDLSPKTIQRFLNMITSAGSSGEPLALKVERSGKPNQYKIRWDFTLKRSHVPGLTGDKPEVCPGHDRGGATSFLNNPFNRKKDKNTRDSKGVYEPINWNRMMYKFREKIQSNQLTAVIGKFIKQRNYHEEQPSRIRYFWTQLNQFIKKLKQLTGQPIRSLYHDIMEILHKIMFIDYNTARERNRFPWKSKTCRTRQNKICQLLPDHSTPENKTEIEQENNTSNYQKTGDLFDADHSELAEERETRLERLRNRYKDAT
ncbi:MAG: hypothetical protein ABEJ65_03870 [bacterium]